METIKLALGYFRRSIASSEIDTYFKASSNRVLASANKDLDIFLLELAWSLSLFKRIFGINSYSSPFFI